MYPDPREPERPSQDADTYVFDDEDLDRIASEIYVHLHMHPRLTRTEAMEIADMAYSLMSGRWLHE